MQWVAMELELEDRSWTDFSIDLLCDLSEYFQLSVSVFLFVMWMKCWFLPSFPCFVLFTAFAVCADSSFSAPWLSVFQESFHHHRWY